MGIFNKLRNELIDIIEWVDDSRHTIAWRFPRYQNEIKNGAQLIVRPGQVAVFVLNGQIADSFEPGHYTLKTDNLPILSTLAGWKYGFNSPFKAEVYFVCTRQLTDMKWGTPNPIMLRDADFGPVRLRAFGTYALKVVNPKVLLEELIGTDSRFEADEVTELVRSVIATSFAELLGSSKISALDLAANYRSMSDELLKLANEKVDDEFGLDLTQMFIVNISLPEEVEKALDTRSSMGVIGDMTKFQQFQMGKAMTLAAENPSGGGAAEGMGLGMGFAMASRMVQAGQPGVVGGVAPPPLPNQTVWHVALNGQSQGPFETPAVLSGIQAGQIKSDTLVWNPALGNWTPAGNVSEFSNAFVVAPPPLPQ